MFAVMMFCLIFAAVLGSFYFTLAIEVLQD